MFLGVFHDRRLGLVGPSRFFRAPHTIFKKKMAVFEKAVRRNWPNLPIFCRFLPFFAIFRPKFFFWAAKPPARAAQPPGRRSRPGGEAARAA